MKPPEDSRVLVTGAAGFIGKPVVRALLERGYRVRAMVRGASPFEPEARIEVVRGDMRDSESLRNAAEGAQVVVHLAAAKSDEKWSEEVNVGGATSLVEASRGAGCTRIINISSQSAKIAKKGVYAKTKSAADAILENSGLDVTTLMPSIVYGDELNGVFGTVAGFVKKLPVVPVLGNGKWISAPVYVGDVANAICTCVETDATIGKRYDIAGPDSISFDEFIDRISTELLLKRRKLHVPFSVALLAARVSKTLLARPPITVSNVLGSNQDTRIDIRPAQKDFGFAPMRFQDGLVRVLRHQEKITGSGARVPKSDSELETEFRMFSQHLIGRTPSTELTHRYAAASRALQTKLDLAGSDAELKFVLRHPRTLPFVDAAAGFLRHDGQFRAKLLLAAAILEASTDHADIFLSKARNPIAVMTEVAISGAISAAKIAVGIPLLWLARAV